jgi:hypothetical protein
MLNTVSLSAIKLGQILDIALTTFYKEQQYNFFHWNYILHAPLVKCFSLVLLLSALLQITSRLMSNKFKSLIQCFSTYSRTMLM